MKNYVWFEAKATKRIYWGYNITLKIYRVIKNELKYIGETKYCTASTRWTESEVYNYLIDNKEIPKKAYKLSESPCSDPWYYQHNNPYCKIKIIESL